MDFSIVTPTFKQPEWVRLCSNSVLDQEGVSLEHIVQDGSDGVGLEWMSDQPRVRLYVEKDKGMYDALRIGMGKGQGSIMAHLNSDEQYLPGTLAKVKRFFDEHPETEVLFGDAILTNADGVPLSYRRVSFPLRSHTIACHLGTLTCSAFFRRSLLDRGLGYTDAWRYIGDSALVLGWLNAGVKMAKVGEALSVFSFTGANLSTTSGAAEEGIRFQAENPLPFYKSPAILAAGHRIRKLLNGAYAKRDVEIAIYTRASPFSRQKFKASHLGFWWPDGA